ncbi:hypothetical protein RclHR1_03010007 [Rhizophagus clarus]|uniref:Uncharacterized protein n=1 Tax=Rhizophagus clarus TaxID=94130 RepID=A0A2Z6RHQ0_9GLOM|nr:hypothetical protein RclHR1_03010007 [Rhizophagus clarus]GES85621.1 hypothetical protein GLOIN_2v1835724 [Rhizophagus clarus]
MDQSRNPNFTENDGEISNISNNNLNISGDSSDASSYKTNNSSSYTSLVIRIRRNRRRLRRRTRINDTLNRISILPIQNTNDPFQNQIFNGSAFH